MNASFSPSSAAELPLSVSLSVSRRRIASLCVSFPSHSPSPSMSASLAIPFPVSLHIRFVGDSFPPSAASTFSSFLSAVVTGNNFHIICPPSDSPINHRLAVSHSLHLDASLSPYTFSSRLDKALKSLISDTTSSLRSLLLSIPYGPIDEIVKQEYDKEKGPFNASRISL